MSERLAAGHVAEEHLLELAHGDVAEGDRRAWLDHLKACQVCEGRFLELCRDREVARATYPAAITTSRHAPRARWLVAGGLAASLLTTVLLVRQRERPPLVPDWLPAEASEGMARGQSPCPADQAEGAVAAYRAHDASRVVALLSERPLSPECDPLGLLLASALVHAHAATQSLAVLERLDVESLPQPARDRGRWIQALAFDQTGKRRKADRILRDLASRTGEFQAKAAGALQSR